MNKKKMISVIGGTTLFVLVLVAVAAGILKKVSAARAAEAKYALQAAPLPVAVERVRAEKAEPSRGYPGTVRAIDESALSFRVGGPLITVNAVPGVPVKKGDLLMQIDPRDFEDRILMLEAQLAGAQAVLENAQADYDRATRLFDEAVIARADFDRAISTRNSAQSAVRNLVVQLQIARHSLADTELRAPYDGQVIARLAENYEMVVPGATVVQYHDIEWLEVTVNVPESETIRRAPEQGALGQVSFMVAPGRRYKAELKEWRSASDEMTRTYAVTFRFEAPQDIKVLPGMSAEVTWSNESAAVAQLQVPVSALVSDADGGSFVWVFNELSKTAEKRAVQTGPLSGASRITVLKGLEEGDLVIISGSRLIRENQAITATSM